MSISTHSSSAGAATVKRLTTSTRNGRGRASRFGLVRPQGRRAGRVSVTYRHRAAEASERFGGADGAGGLSTPPLRLTKATVFVFVFILHCSFHWFSGFPCPRVAGFL